MKKLTRGQMSLLKALGESRQYIGGAKIRTAEKLTALGLCSVVEVGIFGYTYQITRKGMNLLKELSVKD